MALPFLCLVKTEHGSALVNVHENLNQTLTKENGFSVNPNKYNRLENLSENFKKSDPPKSNKKKNQPKSIKEKGLQKRSKTENLPTKKENYNPVNPPERTNVTINMLDINKEDINEESLPRSILKENPRESIHDENPIRSTKVEHYLVSIKSENRQESNTRENPLTKQNGFSVNTPGIKTENQPESNKKQNSTSSNKVKYPRNRTKDSHRPEGMNMENGPQDIKQRKQTRRIKGENNPAIIENSQPPSDTIKKENTPESISLHEKEDVFFVTLHESMENRMAESPTERHKSVIKQSQQALTKKYSHSVNPTDRMKAENHPDIINLSSDIIKTEITPKSISPHKKEHGQSVRPENEEGFRLHSQFVLLFFLFNIFFHIIRTILGVHM